MNNNKVQAIVEKVKELVQRGNVSRIVVRKGERVLLNIPVNVGIVGGVVAVASAKWVLLASILATVGFGCSVEVVKEDGNIVNVMSEEDTRRVRTAAQSAVSSVKDAVHFEKVVDQPCAPPSPACRCRSSTRRGNARSSRGTHRGRAPRGVIPPYAKKHLHRQVK